MEQEKELLEIGNGIEGESESIKKCSEYCCRCEKLESDLEAKRNDIEQLQRQIVVQNQALKSFPKGSDENSSGDRDVGLGGNKCGVDLMEEVENDKVLELLTEISVLNCEKKKAESDVGFWKARCEELESRVRVLENQLSSSKSGMVNPVSKTEAVKEDVATPLIHTFHGMARQENVASGGEILREKMNERSSRSRKQLDFSEKTPDKMAPATPAAGVIDISDDENNNDDDDEGSSLNQHGPQQSMNKAQELSSGYTGIVKDENEIEDDIMHCYEGTSSFPSKRKRASRMVHSDTESDADDNIPLHRLRKKYSNVPQKNSSESKSDGGIPTAGNSADNVPLRRLRKRYSNVDTQPSHQGHGVPQKDSSESKSNPTTGNSADDEPDDSESESEGESLNGFIVSGSESDVSVADKSSEGDEDEIANSNEKSVSESEEKSDGDVDYVEVMSMIGRKKDHLVKWELEGDMLSAFGKDPVLCMKAVCALYRQQTSDEKSCKATKHQNQRGFSQFDGRRGSELGEFLTAGDPEGGLNKSVEELKRFQPDGLELCRTLANRYSKQLFAMYKNKEDPLWADLGDTDS